MELFSYNTYLSIIEDAKDKSAKQFDPTRENDDLFAIIYNNLLTGSGTTTMCESLVKSYANSIHDTLVVEFLDQFFGVGREITKLQKKANKFKLDRAKAQVDQRKRFEAIATKAAQKGISIEDLGFDAEAWAITLKRTLDAISSKITLLETEVDVLSNVSDKHETIARKLRLDGDIEEQDRIINIAGAAEVNDVIQATKKDKIERKRLAKELKSDATELERAMKLGDIKVGDTELRRSLRSDENIARFYKDITKFR